MEPVSASPPGFAMSGASGFAGWPTGISLHRPEPPYPQIDDPEPQPDEGDDGPPDPPTPQHPPAGDPPSREPPERVARLREAGCMRRE